MSNLIKNELTKIFHKKSIYVVLIITVVFMIISGVMNIIFKNVGNNYDFYDIDFYKDRLAELDKNNPDDREPYISYSSQLKVAELASQYDKNSWQRYILDSKGFSIINEMYANEGTEKYKESKGNYEKFIERLNSNSWQDFAREEIEDINLQIKTLEESRNFELKAQEKNNIEIQLQNLRDQKQALEWRIEKDISYGKNYNLALNINLMPEQWVNSRMDLLNINEREKTQPLSYSEKYEKQNFQEMVALCEYGIKNKKDNLVIENFNDRYNLSTESTLQLVQLFSNYGIFIIIAIVVIAGTIVSEEFNKGTIKLLLVRPYKRTKILVAKFIACLVVLCLTFIVIAFAQFIVGGIFNGFENYASDIQVFNFKTNSVESMSGIRYLILSGLAILPQYILIMTLAFTLSILFTNSAIAVALPLLGIMGSEIINEIAYHVEKAKFLRFFVTPNWDLRMFLFGKLPEFEPISLPFSLTICLVYFVIMAIISMVVFKKKEIKNI